VGALPGAEYEEATVRLFPQDKLLMFTDGVTETFKDGRLEECYGEQRLKRILQSNAHMKPEELLASIVEDVEGFSGNSLFSDDITLLLLSVK
jgi:protein phosphatase